MKIHDAGPSPTVTSSSAEIVVLEMLESSLVLSVLGVPNGNLELKGWGNYDRAFGVILGVGAV